MTSNEKPVSNVLRKSCQFCRSRKIRCSGERVCNACRVRSIECIYGLEGNRGRPRADKSKCEARKSTPSRSRSKLVRNGIPEPLGHADPQAAHDPLLGSELEAVFRMGFLGISHPDSPSSNRSGSGTHSSYQDPVESAAMLSHLSTQNSYVFERRLSSCSGVSMQPTVSTRATISYEDLFANMSFGLVEQFSNLFGSLGCQAPQHTISSYLANNLTGDTTPTMFDSASFPSPLPTSAFGEEHYIRQMIELWFMHHPLSILLSKTLILQRLRTGELDQALLAVILADANYGLGGQKIETARRLFSTAAEILRNQHRNSYTLATVQAMIFLGWHKICYDSARRGYVFLTCARRLVIELQKRSLQSPPPPADSLNGISISEVEAELIQRIYCFTSGIELWTCVQLDIPLCNRNARDVPLAYPPLDASQSLVFALDQESGNVASLRKQERLLRQFWPLCHLSSTLTGIYEYYTRSVQGTGTWTPDESHSASLTLIGLRRLLRSCDVSHETCRSLRETLMGVIDSLEADRSSDICQSSIIAGYRTILLHLLFPSTDAENVYTCVTEMTFQAAVQEIFQFRDLLNLTENLPPAELEVIDAARRCHNEIFVMGLDACGRALERLVDTGNYGTAQLQQAVSMSRGELLELATSLHRFSKHPKIQIVVGADEVKARLKLVKQSLQAAAAAAGQNHQIHVPVPAHHGSDWSSMPDITGASWMQSGDAFMRVPTSTSNTMHDSMSRGAYVGLDGSQLQPALDWNMHGFENYAPNPYQPTTGV